MTSLSQCKKSKHFLSPDDSTIFERCILCGSLTDVPQSMHIELRYGYIEGAGQLCRKCYHGIYEQQYEKRYSEA